MHAMPYTVLKALHMYMYIYPTASMGEAGNSIHHEWTQHNSHKLLFTKTTGGVQYKYKGIPR